MKIEQIDMYAQLRGAGIDTEKLREEMGSSESQYFQYHTLGSDNDLVINVESTARSVMEEFTRMPVDYQQRIFYLIGMLLKKSGEQIIITGDEKKRGARIVRLASDKENVLNLLLTH